MTTMTLAWCCALSLLAQPEAQTTANPLFAQLLSPGLALTAERRLPLPPPTMADGLDAAGQRAVIEQLIQGSYSFDDFARPSPVAPHLLKFRELEKLDPLGRVQIVELWSIAYGSLDNFRRNPEKDVVFKQRAGSQVHELTADELAQRQLKATASDAFEENYTYSSFEIFDKVQLSGTNHTVLTRTPESIVVAIEIDTRFNGDAKFANAWRAVMRAGAQDVTLGEPQPYQGFGSYFKVTKLREPAGALFCEYHLIFLEPQGWFNGANLLRSKLPIAVQTEVRNFRRELKP
ncbi:MAG: hypothetical protein JNM18_19045 [Planctomycetaceae bacterium]|nr:hypothetical protein [Planctomycetaceae bacterium]